MCCDPDEDDLDAKVCLGHVILASRYQVLNGDRLLADSCHYDPKDDH
jgi:hypothetical protein